MRSVAVLGANGFIGSRTVEFMHLSGWAKVRPVVRRPAALAGACRFALELGVADARDARALTVAFTGCEYVVHAVAGDSATIVDTIEPVYRAADAAGVRRLVYLSSASVHGQSPASDTDEMSALDDKQTIDYNNAKIRAERRLKQQRNAGKVEVVILRPGIVFGPRSRWTGGFADELLEGTARLVDGGHGICNSAYVDNVVHAVCLATEAPDADGRAYLIGDAETATWADLCRPVAQALGFDLSQISVYAPSIFRPEPPSSLRNSKLLRGLLNRAPEYMSRSLRAGYVEWRLHRAPHHDRRDAVPEEVALLHRCRTKLPSTRAERELGYHPIVSFDEGCMRSVRWLTFAGYPTIEIRQPR